MGLCTRLRQLARVVVGLEVLLTALVVQKILRALTLRFEQRRWRDSLLQGLLQLLLLVVWGEHLWRRLVRRGEKRPGDHVSLGV